MKKFLAVAICLLCAFALASGADLVLATERIVTTDPDGKKIEWFWDNGELAAEKTLGHTDMPGGFKARNISLQFYGKPTRHIDLADAMEMWKAIGEFHLFFLLPKKKKASRQISFTPLRIKDLPKRFSPRPTKNIPRLN